MPVLLDLCTDVDIVETATGAGFGVGVESETTILRICLQTAVHVIILVCCSTASIYGANNGQMRMTLETPPFS